MDETTPALDPMAETALRSMKDIVVPPAISMMPQTWGWLLLGGIIAGSLVAWAIFALARYRRNAYRREALQLLVGIEERLSSEVARQEAVYEVGQILKQVAIAAWGRTKVANLSDDGWAQFLAEHGGAAKPDGRPLERLVDDFEYRHPAALRRMPLTLAGELAEDARKWIKYHHV